MLLCISVGSTRKIHLQTISLIPAVVPETSSCASRPLFTFICWQLLETVITKKH